MISTSCSVPNCFNNSLSSFGPSFFSITAIFCLSYYHTCQYPTTSILTNEQIRLLVTYHPELDKFDILNSNQSYIHQCHQTI
jgi:hypothetical protein